jgi:hypothetical protein
LMASVQAVLIREISSTILAVQGKSSLTHIPDLPWRANLYLECVYVNR